MSAEFDVTLTKDSPENQIVAFEPGVIIELTDLLGGFRKLAIVGATGIDHCDLDDYPEDEIAWFRPNFIKQNPVEIMTMNAMAFALVDEHLENPNIPNYADDLVAVYMKAIDMVDTTLQLERATYWAYKNRIFDVELAVAAAYKEADEIRKFDKMLSDALEAVEEK